MPWATLWANFSQTHLVALLRNPFFHDDENVNFQPVARTALCVAFASF
jgi:hypothetical protein